MTTELLVWGFTPLTRSGRRARARRVVGEPRVRGGPVAAEPVDEDLLPEPQHPAHGSEHRPRHLLAALGGELVQQRPERRRVAGPELEPPLLRRLDLELEPVAPVEYLLVGVDAVDAVTLGLEPLAAVGVDHVGVS